MLGEAHEQLLVLQQRLLPSHTLPKGGLVVRRELPKGARIDGCRIHGVARLATDGQREAALPRQRHQRAAAHHLVRVGVRASATVRVRARARVRVRARARARVS